MLLLLLALTLSGCNLTKVATQAIEQGARQDGLEERRAVLGASQVRYWIGGQGPPLLLLHGFGGDGLMTWNKQVDDLIEHHTLIVPDLLWFGESFAVGLEPTLGAQVATMVALLDHEGIDQTDIAGISYGGFVTLLLQQQHPERLDRVVIVDSPGPVFSADDRQAMLDRLGVDDPEAMFVPETPEAVARLISIVRPGGPAIPRFLLQDIQQAHFSRNHDEHRALLSDLLLQDSAYPPGTWKLPTRALVIWGSEDPVFPLSEGQELARALGADLVVIEGAAHGPNFQEPAEFNAALLAWLARTTDG